MKSQQEYLDLFINTAQDEDPTLTDTNEGSLIDVIGGAVSTAAEEVEKTIVDEFAKTFVETANGPEITRGPDDLERLFVDHFGELFERPGATFSQGVVTLSRPNTDAGNVVIPAGTIVKTLLNSAGVSQRVRTEIEVTLTGTSINASAVAVVAGPSGNVNAGTLTEIETSLTDSSVEVTNSQGFSGGKNELNDAEYREFARNLLLTLKGATLRAVEAMARTVPGVESVTGKETVVAVKEWDLENSEAVGDYFFIIRVKLYIADANGEANPALVAAVNAAINPIRACGVKIEVIGAEALTHNWTISIVLDSGGPNYATLQEDTTLITDLMNKYVQDLEIGEYFSRVDAKNYLMSVFGPGGTGDLTNLTILSPTGDVAVSATQKLIAGTMSVQ